MTECQSLSGNKLEKGNPWNVKDKANRTTHIYPECNKALLMQGLGDMFINLILAGIKQAYLKEFKRPGYASSKPLFLFDYPPRMEFDQSEKRYIDKNDYTKLATLKKYTNVFFEAVCGTLSHRQYYYFDLRQIATKYYVNVSTKQISGLYWNPDEKHFIGLENYKEKGIHRFRHVQLDNEILTTSF